MAKIKVWLIRSPLFAPIAVLGVAISSNVAYAQVVTTQATLNAALCNVINAMIWVLLSVSVIMVVYAAFQYVTGGADAEKVSTARKTLTYAAVGIAVALIAKGFPLVVKDVFGSGASGVGSTFSCS